MNYQNLNINYMNNPFLIGENVYLRPLSLNDLESNYLNWLNDPITNLQNSHHTFPYSKDDLTKYITNAFLSRDKLPLAIIDKTNDFHFGNISLANIDFINRRSDWGIIIGEKEYWNKGYSKEASFLLLKHAFDNLNLHRIYSGTTSKNIGGQKLMLSMGMIKEGVRREHLFKEGKYEDTIEYGVFREEFYTKFKLK